jgi:hypothetical protein
MISPRRRLLADVAPAYVASLRLRPTRVAGQAAWDAADYTAHPRGHGHGAALRNRLERLATAEQKAIVLRAREPGPRHQAVRRVHPAARSAQRAPAAVGVAAARGLTQGYSPRGRAVRSHPDGSAGRRGRQAGAAAAGAVDVLGSATPQPWLPYPPGRTPERAWEEPAEATPDPLHALPTRSCVPGPAGAGVRCP